jgi:iron complex transport system ATP-binding protein
MSLRSEQASVRLGARRVVDGLSIDVKPGELVAVAGANGAGKSTTLKLLAGLIAPEAGGVALDGRPLRDFKGTELGRRIAFLPQDRTVHWALKSERVVALGRLPHRRFAAGENPKDRAAIASAMARMDVADFKDRPIAALSGGERARVLVARALAQEAEYLITDEPAAGLDPAHSLELFEELARLARDGHGVVTALHDLSLAARFATRVVLLKCGVCLADGPPARVLSRENLAAAFGIDAIVSEVSGIPVVLPRSFQRTTASLT